MLLQGALNYTLKSHTYKSLYKYNNYSLFNRLKGDSIDPAAIYVSKIHFII